MQESNVTQGSNDAAEMMGSFQKTAPRQTAVNTVKHRDGGVGSVVANGGESSVVVTTLPDTSTLGKVKFQSLTLTSLPVNIRATWLTSAKSRFQHKKIQD